MPSLKLMASLTRSQPDVHSFLKLFYQKEWAKIQAKFPKKLIYTHKYMQKNIYSSSNKVGQREICNF